MMETQLEKQQTIKGILNQWIIDILVDLKERKIKRIDTRRIWPLFVIVLIVLVTITHEATYAGSFETPGYQFIGWPYALAINLAIIVGEYFIQWKSSRIAAWATFIIATAGSGALNIAYVKPWEYTGFDEFFAWIYSLLPTIIIVCLGLLSSRVARIARTQEARWEREDEKEYKCWCGSTYNKPIQLANHTRTHIKELKHNPQAGTGVEAIIMFQNLYPNRPKYPSLEQIKKWAGKK